MRIPRLCFFLTAISLLTIYRTWANDCGFPGPDQVVIYQQSDRGDACAVLEVGNHADASAFRLPDNSISALDVGSNVRAILYEGSGFILREAGFDQFNRFQPAQRQAHFEGGFYYDPIGNVDNRTSSIEIFRMQGGPAATWYLEDGDFPSNSENFWSENAQGLANDGTNWFITTKTTIFKVPLSVNLDRSSSSGIVQTGMPSQLKRLGYDHFGDPDQYEGFLFVPGEHPDKGSRPRIAVFSTVDLRFLSSFRLSDNSDRSGVSPQ